MLFWLDHMEFDNKTRCFHKLNLNVSNSKRFTKQFALLWFIIKRANLILTFISFTVFILSFLVFKHDYYLYYITSIILISISVWFMACHWIGLTLVLYQVN